MTKKIAVYATAAVAGLGLSACGGGAAGDKGGNSTTESISDTFNEANKLENELYQAVNRLIVDCMEEQDFDVHPRQLLELAPENEGYNPFDDAETPDSHNIPTVKDAKKEGFGFNLYLVRSMTERVAIPRPARGIPSMRSLMSTRGST